MNTRNIIFIIGNGFDLAHSFKTKFSDFADYYLRETIVPELIECITTRRKSPDLFQDAFISKLARPFSQTVDRTPENIICYLGNSNDKQKLSEYLQSDYSILRKLLKNALLTRLYTGTEKHWFDIENIYFQELIPLKDQAINKPKLYNVDQLNSLNSNFSEIKLAVIEYLQKVEITPNDQIKNFLEILCRNCQLAYFINFNYTSSVQKYIVNSERFIVNHIHGNLTDKNIIFGYGNDQNEHYQQMKELEIEQFLDFFKTFDYLQDSNYDNIYDEALNKMDEYDVCVVGHSLGMTDKTLISEVLNSEKCRRIFLFKRADLKDNPLSVRNEYKKLSYAASRILTDEIKLRKKVVNFKNSTFFPG